MRITDSINVWLENIAADEAAKLRQEWEDSPNNVEDAFAGPLVFGTGGLRGLMGIGPNRMNEYTVGQATQGLSNYLLSKYKDPSVVVCRDSRNGGGRFVDVVAGVLAANNIKVKVFPRVEPTPALSFAVRVLGCSAGINITASHNPAEYNGYKVYGADGCQITSLVATEIQSLISRIDIFQDVKSLQLDEAFHSGMIQWVDDKVLEQYLSAIVNYDSDIRDIRHELSLVYTPLNGVGLECISSLFSRIQIDDYCVVPEQAFPNGDFPTCASPNPELHKALELGISLFDLTNSDLLLATDPDADRVGVVARHDERYQQLTGNEVGILLLNWLSIMHLQSGCSLNNKVVVTTIVSSALADALAVKYGFELRRTLTGFKFIGEQIGLLESEGELDRFLFGFEESCGYLAGTHARDKDGVMASMLICQMARWYKKKGRSVYDALEEIYSELGYYQNDLVSLTYAGLRGTDLIQQIMIRMRMDPPRCIAGLKVIGTIDYLSEIEMPIINNRDGFTQKLGPSNVLEFVLEDDSKLIIRPSGTEPKIKAYIFSKAATHDEAKIKLRNLKRATQKLLKE